MDRLTKHYRQLLGLDASWEVSEVSFSLEEKRAEIVLRHLGGAVTCPDCQAECSIADHTPQRAWRHLDTMQFETVLRDSAPWPVATGPVDKTVATMAAMTAVALRGRRPDTSRKG